MTVKKNVVNAPSVNCHGFGKLSEEVTFFYSFFYGLYVFLFFKEAPVFLITCVRWLISFASLGAQINLIFAFFNLIPIPPFDGSRIALVFLPTKIYFGIMRYEREIMYGLLILLLASSYLFDFSPFSWLAYRVINLVEPPLSRGFINLFSSLV